MEEIPIRDKDPWGSIYSFRSSFMEDSRLLGAGGALGIQEEEDSYTSLENIRLLTYISLPKY